MMKKRIKYRIYTLGFALALTFTSCMETIDDYGFTGSISGRVLDNNGNIISGDVTTEDMMVLALGEGETEPQRLRVLGDGTFKNNHLYPQVYTLTLLGAAVSTQQITVDLTGGHVNQDINATPFISLPPPDVLGSPINETVTLAYNMIPNGDNTVEERSVYVSTVFYPGQTTGSGPYWNTIRRTLPENQGNITIDGLSGGTTYYVRTAAKAEGTNWWNLSDQLVINIP